LLDQAGRAARESVSMLTLAILRPSPTDGIQIHGMGMRGHT